MVTRTTDPVCSPARRGAAGRNVHATGKVGRPPLCLLLTYTLLPLFSSALSTLISFLSELTVNLHNTPPFFLLSLFELLLRNTFYELEIRQRRSTLRQTRSKHTGVSQKDLSFPSISPFSRIQILHEGKIRPAVRLLFNPCRNLIASFSSRSVAVRDEGNFRAKCIAIGRTIFESMSRRWKRISRMAG